MIIDFHTHVFPDKIAKPVIENLSKASNNIANTDGTVGGLILDMNKSGVDISITLPVVTNPEQFDSINRFALFINENYSKGDTKLISFGGIHPACDNLKEKMLFLKKSGFLGVKIHPDYQKTFIDDDGYIEILKCAKDLDLIIVTHAGVDNGFPGLPVKCLPQLALKVIDKVGYDKFVLAHYGGYDEWQDAYKLLAGKNVYFDTAFTFHKIEERLFKQILNKHGEDKVLFATDNPWSNASNDISTIKSFNLNQDVLDKILYKNAVKLLNIDYLEK